MMRIKKSLGILLLLGGMTVHFAQEENLAQAYLKKVDTTMYRPVNHGLTTLETEILNSTLSQHPLLKSLKAKFYFKKGSPSESKLEILGLEQLPPEVREIQSQLRYFENAYQEFFSAYAGELIGSTFEEKFKDFQEITLKKGAFDEITLVPHPESPWSKSFLRQVLKFQNHRILSLETFNIDGTKSHSDFNYFEKESQVLIRTVESRKGSLHTIFHFEYQTVNKVVLLQKIKGTTQSQTPFTIEFKETKVNFEFPVGFFENE